MAKNKEDSLAEEQMTDETVEAKPAKSNRVAYAKAMAMVPAGQDPARYLKSQDVVPVKAFVVTANGADPEKITAVDEVEAVNFYRKKRAIKEAHKVSFATAPA